MHLHVSWIHLSKSEVLEASMVKIVSDSDCELMPEIDQSVVNMVAKKHIAVKRRAKRLQTKLIAERRFLQRKRAKRTSTVLKTCTDIGSVIEDFVKEHNVGADAWRRTGILTFDGNANHKDNIDSSSYSECIQENVCIWNSSRVVCGTEPT